MIQGAGGTATSDAAAQAAAERARQEAIERARREAAEQAQREAAAQAQREAAAQAQREAAAQAQREAAAQAQQAAAQQAAQQTPPNDAAGGTAATPGVDGPARNLTDPYAERTSIDPNHARDHYQARMGDPGVVGDAAQGAERLIEAGAGVAQGWEASADRAVRNSDFVPDFAERPLESAIDAEGIAQGALKWGGREGLKHTVLPNRLLPEDVAQAQSRATAATDDHMRAKSFAHQVEGLAGTARRGADLATGAADIARNLFTGAITNRLAGGVSAIAGGVRSVADGAVNLAQRDVDRKAATAQRLTDEAKAMADNVGSNFGNAVREAARGGIAGGVVNAGFEAWDQRQELADPNQRSEAIGEIAGEAGVGILAGVAAGAAVGSVVPVAGTLVGAAAGLVVGLAADKGLRAMNVDDMVADGITNAIDAAPGIASDAIEAVTNPVDTFKSVFG